MNETQLENIKLNHALVELITVTFPEIAEIEGSPLATLKPPPVLDCNE